MLKNRLLALLLVVGLGAGGSTPASAVPPGAAPRRVVLVLDRSGSMGEEGRWGRLLDAAGAMLMALPDNTELAVVVFNDGADVLASLGPLSASMRTDIIKRLEKLTQEGGTDMLVASILAQQQLNGRAGVLVLLSDGAMTGKGRIPLGEDIWGDDARKLCQELRKQAVVMHCLGLGESVESDPLLNLLSGETGGQFRAVRQPADLLRHFVELASQLGEFWMLDKPGEFEVPAPSTVVDISLGAASHRLLHLVDGRRVPVDPVEQAAVGNVRTDRFQLTPGKYEYQPAGKDAHLLRPSELSWQFADVPLAAGRLGSIWVRASAARPSAIQGLTVRAAVRFQGHEQHIVTEAAADREGKCRLQLTTPARLVPFNAALTAHQGGWLFDLGSRGGQTVLPTPLEVTLSSPRELPLELQTKASEPEVQLPLRIQSSLPGLSAELIITSSSAAIRVEPSRVVVNRADEMLDITLRRMSNPRELNASLTFRVEADDLVPPRINGAAQVTWPVHWTELMPAIFVDNVDPSYAMKRGTSLEIPLPTSHRDVTPYVWLILTPQRVPAGFSVRWADVEGDQPLHGKPPRLQVTADKSVLPGRHEIQLGIRPSDPTIPINGSLGGLLLKFDIVIDKVALAAAPTRLDSWTVIAPDEAATREVELKVQPADGGTLPAFNVTHDDTPLAGDSQGDEGKVVNVTMTEDETSPQECRQITFTLAIPAQTRPQTRTLEFKLEGDSIVPTSVTLPCEIDAGCITADVSAAHIPTVWMPHFVPSWIRSRFLEPATVEVSLTGPGSDLAEWSVEESTPDGGWRRIEGTGNVCRLDPSRQYEIAVASRYVHAHFNPADRIPLETRLVPRPLPAWCHALWVAPLGLLLLGTVWRTWPVRVVYQSRMRWGAGQLRLQRVVGEPGLKLTLRRRRLKRGRRDKSGLQVEVLTGGLGPTPVPPGETVQVQPGETIRIIGPSPHNLEIPANRRSAGYGSEPGLTSTQSLVSQSFRADSSHGGIR